MSHNASLLICSADGRLAEALADLPSLQGADPRQGPSAIVLDLGEAPTAVAACVGGVRRRHPALPVVVVGDASDPGCVVEAIRAGAHDWVPSPVKPDRLTRSVEDALLRRAVAEESRDLLSILERRSREVEADRRQLGRDLASMSFDLEAANARLESAHRELQGRVAQLVMLYRIGRDLSGQRNWDQSLSQFLRNVATFLRADGAGLLLFSQGTRVLAPRSAVGLDDEILAQACEALLSRDDAGAGEPALFPLESYGQGAPVRCVEYRLPWRYTVLPLRKRDRDLGYLVLDKAYPGDIHDDLYFLITVQTILSEEVAGAQAVSQLRRLQQFQAGTLDNVASGIVTVDAEGSLLYANQKAGDLLREVGAPDSLGQRLRIGAARQALSEWLEGAPHSGTLVAEGWLESPGDEPLPVALRACRLPAEGAEAVRFVAIVDDLRSVRQLESERRRAARQDELLIMAAEWAHDVRTPLTGILHGSELLADALPAGSPHRRHHEMIQREVERLNGLVSNFLDFAKPVRLERASTNVEEMLAEVMQLMRPRAELHGVELMAELPSLPGHPLVDRNQLKQVVLNLVSNAIEASPAGGSVWMRLRHETDSGELAESGPPAAAVSLDVVDEGPGVAPDHVDRLFVPFFTTKPEGTGLGLAISEKVVRGHGGHLRYQRARGRTTLRLVVPFVLEETLAVPSGFEPSLRARG